MQYVLYPMTATGIVICEIWVEPQYASVGDASPGLQYLVGATTEDIPFKVACLFV